MALIKIISHAHSCDVEEAVNAWLQKNKANILQVKYHTSCHEEEIWHSVLILYEPGKDE